MPTLKTSIMIDRDSRPAVAIQWGNVLDKCEELRNRSPYDLGSDTSDSERDESVSPGTLEDDENNAVQSPKQRLKKYCLTLTQENRTQIESLLRSQIDVVNRPAVTSTSVFWSQLPLETRVADLIIILPEPADLDIASADCVYKNIHYEGASSQSFCPLFTAKRDDSAPNRPHLSLPSSTHVQGLLDLHSVGRLV